MIARLGKGVDLSAPAVAAISPSRDGLAFVGRSSVKMSEGRSLGLLFAKVGLDPLSSHHDTGLVFLRRIDLLLRLTLEKVWPRREGWEAIERSKARMAAIGVGKLQR